MPFDAIDAMSDLNPWWLAGLWCLMLAYTVAVTWELETIARWAGRVALAVAMLMLAAALNDVFFGLSVKDLSTHRWSHPLYQWWRRYG